MRYKACHGNFAPATLTAGRVAFEPHDAEAANESPDVKIGVIVAGTQKGGTSALKVCMIEHPEIGMPKDVKEAHFFDTEENFTTPGPDYSVYHRMYERAPGVRVYGDATPVYMFWEPALQRIWRYNPAMKLVVLLRNPGTRAYSHWNMEIKQGRESLPFEDAIRDEQDRCRAALPLQHRRWSYIARGMYSEQLRRIWRHFPHEQVMVLKSEEFQADPAPALAQLARWLGVGAFPNVAPRNVFALPYEAPMSAQARRFLRDTYEIEIRRIERMLGWDCADWLSELEAR